MEQSEKKDNWGKILKEPLKTLIEKNTVIDLRNAVTEVAISLEDP